MGGGKGGGGAPSPPPIMQQPQSNMGPFVEMMQLMFAQVQESYERTMTPPPVPAMPPIFQAPTVDWDAKLQQLNTDALDEQFREDQNRRGRLDTILTSPLLDEEDVETTLSLLEAE